LSPVPGGVPGADPEVARLGEGDEGEAGRTDDGGRVMSAGCRTKAAATAEESGPIGRKSNTKSGQPIPLMLRAKTGPEAQGTPIVTTALPFTLTAR
jgi:hypothetical protein